MDKQDYRILQFLSDNARISGAAIARKLNLSLPAVTERLRKLERSGMIDKFTIRYNRKRLGQNLVAFIQVWMDHSKGSTQAKEEIIAMPEILECHHAAGDYDLLLKILVADTAALENLLVNKIKKIKNVTKTSTTIMLNTYKEEINVKTELQ